MTPFASPVSRSRWKKRRKVVPVLRGPSASKSAGKSSPPYRCFCARRRSAKVSSTGSSASRSTPSVSQQASKSPGSALRLTKLPSTWARVQPAARSASSAAFSPASSPSRRGVDP